MDDYLIFDDAYTSNKPSGYYIEKAFFKDKTGINYNRTHFMTNTLFGYYDPDKGTNTRWWETDETSSRCNKIKRTLLCYICYLFFQIFLLFVL